MNPTQYDRLLVKNLRNMKDGGNAIFNTEALDYAFANDEARKNLALQSIADNRESRDAGFAENQKQFDIGMARNKGQFEFRRNMADMQISDAEDADKKANLFGWGDIALGGVQGYNAYNKEKNQANEMDEMTKIIKQMIRR